MTTRPVSFNYSVAPHLAEFNVPQSTFAASRPEFTDFVAGAFIFSRGRSPETPRLLLLQRASSDAFGDFWDYPGGSCDPDDSTLLEGLAREVFEETGYHVSRVVDLVAVNTWVRAIRSVRKMAKFSFIVEVHESAPPVAASSVKDTQNDLLLQQAVTWEDTVKLAENEHQAYAWATEAEILHSVRNGRYKFVGVQGSNVPEAFRKIREIA